MAQQPGHLGAVSSAWVEVCKLTTAAVQDGKWDDVRRNVVAVMDASGGADAKAKTKCCGAPDAGAEPGGQQSNDGDANAEAEGKDEAFRLLDFMKKEQPENLQQ
jgi:hypothetical protein